jgi:hypothetical protein
MDHVIRVSRSIDRFPASSPRDPFRGLLLARLWGHQIQEFQSRIRRVATYSAAIRRLKTVAQTGQDHPRGRRWNGLTGDVSGTYAQQKTPARAVSVRNLCSPDSEEGV